MFLSVNGSAVTMLVDNQYTLSYAFDPRLDNDGFVHGIHEGMVGLGANNARARIDNVTVQRLVPVVTFSETLDFDSGTTSSLLQTPTSGTWELSNGHYHGMADGSVPAISLSSLLVSPASRINLSAVMSTTGEVGFLFDQYDPVHFKFVTIVAGHITVGHRTAQGWFTDATVDLNFVAQTENVLGLTIAGATVSITLNDQPVLSHAFNALVTDGQFGLFGRVGTTSFDTLTVESDDPAYAAGQAGPPASSARPTPSFSTSVLPSMSAPCLTVWPPVSEWMTSGRRRYNQPRHGQGTIWERESSEIETPLTTCFQRGT